MLTLHGFPYSNYHNMVKHALMYKELPFEEHIVYPNTPEMLAINPTGKAPALTTEEGVTLSESSVLLDYLEEAYPQRPLYPSEPLARAQIRQLMKVSELYLELPARRLLPSVLSNMPADEATLEDVRKGLERAARSLNALASFSPWVAGENITMADIYLRYSLAIPKLVGPSLLKWDIMTAVEGLEPWDAMMADSDISRQIDADQAANAEEFMAFISSPK